MSTTPTELTSLRMNVVCLTVYEVDQSGNLWHVYTCTCTSGKMAPCVIDSTSAMQGIFGASLRYVACSDATLSVRVMCIYKNFSL